jgi:hypothetical protein
MKHMEKLNTEPTKVAEQSVDSRERSETFLSPEQASAAAEKTKEKIDFLNSVKDKINAGEALTGDEDVRYKELFGDKKIEKGYVGWEISFLQDVYYQQATAGIDGASHVGVAYPTGMDYKASEFGEFAKSNEQNIQNLYHEIGTMIDRSSEQIVATHNRNENAEQIGWYAGETHAQRWFTPRVVDEGNEKSFVFSYGGDQFTLKKDNNNNWYCLLKDGGPRLLPNSAATEFNVLDRDAKRLLEQRANQMFH